MSYPKNHTEDHCDKCQKRVGRKNLKPVSFYYKDMNDKTHQDVFGDDYKRYYVCTGCE